MSEVPTNSVNISTRSGPVVGTTPNFPQMPKVETKERVLRDLEIAQFRVAQVVGHIEPVKFTDHDIFYAEDKLARLQINAEDIMRKITEEKWSRPSQWLTQLRDDGRLYIPQGPMALLQSMSEVRFMGSADMGAWNGLEFSITEAKESFVFRRFYNPPFCDVVKASEATTKKPQTWARNLFVQRADTENLATELSLTVFDLLREQSSEKTEVIVAFHFMNS